MSEAEVCIVLRRRLAEANLYIATLAAELQRVTDDRDAAREEVRLLRGLLAGAVPVEVPEPSRTPTRRLSPLG